MLVARWCCGGGYIRLAILLVESRKEKQKMHKCICVSRNVIDWVSEEEGAKMDCKTNLKRWDVSRWATSNPSPNLDECIIAKGFSLKYELFYHFS